ncbi:MAG TPA: DUF975 family protein [Lachnospiraceae bacterium]|nr:DUF975 family protein [Lachnospiraceae bacterium]
MKYTNKELKLRAKTVLSGHYTVSVGISLIMMAIEALSALILLPFSEQGSVKALVFALIISFILRLITSVFFAGLLFHFLKRARGTDCSAADIIAAFRMQPDRFIISELLIVAISAAYALPFAGAYFISSSNAALSVIFFIVWGIGGTILYFVLRLRYALSFFLLLDHQEMGAVESFKTSARLMQGHKGRLMLLLLSFIGWYLLGLLSSFIGFLWIIPYISTALSGYYLDLTGEPASHESDHPASEETYSQV